MRVIWRHVLIVLLAIVLLPAVAVAQDGTPVVGPEPSASVAPPTAIASETPTAEPPSPATPTPTPSMPAPTVAATSTALTPQTTVSPGTPVLDPPPTPPEAQALDFTGDLLVYREFCLDPRRAGEVAFVVEVNTFELLSVGPQDTASAECRYAQTGDGPTTFVLTNTETGRTWTRTLEGDRFIFVDIPWGTYALAATSHGRTVTSAPFPFAAETDDASTILVNYSVIVRTFVAELDLAPGGTGDEPAWVVIAAYVCKDAARDAGGEFIRWGLSGSSASAAVPARTALCREADFSDFLSFVAQPLQPGAAPIRFWTENGSVFYPSTWPRPDNTMPAGDYVITELRSGVSTAPMHFSGWNNRLEFLFYGGPPATSWIMELSSADPAVASVLPAGATWTLSQEGSVRYGGAFWGEVHPLPDEFHVLDPVTNGTYDLAVDAGPAFAPYRARVTIRNILPSYPRLPVVLQPVRPTPSPAPTPTAVPTTAPDPTAHAGAPDASGVTGLPSTGQGERDRDTTDAGVLAGVAAILALAAGLMWRRRTTSR